MGAHVPSRLICPRVGDPRGDFPGLASLPGYLDIKSDPVSGLAADAGGSGLTSSDEILAGTLLRSTLVHYTFVDIYVPSLFPQLSL